MGLREDAARWADDNARNRRNEEAVAARAAAPLPLPDWHAELVTLLRAARVPQIRVYSRKTSRRRYDPSHPSRYFKFSPTGETLWVIRFCAPDNGSRSGWGTAQYLGMTDTALGKADWFGGKVVSFTPFTRGDGDSAPATWRPRLVPLVAALLDSRTEVVDPATGAVVDLVQE